MKIEDAAKYLSEIDAIETWVQKAATLGVSNVKKAIELAETLWVERMVKEGELFVHPDVLRQLENQFWRATDLQKRMIWASVIASADDSDSRVRFKIIKEKLLKKYGRDWWEDVYQRKNNAWAARERIRKYTSSNGPAVSVLINKTTLFSGIAVEEREKALRMIPKA